MSIGYRTIVEENEMLFKFIAEEKNRLVNKAYTIKISIFTVISLYVITEILPSFTKETSLLEGVILCSTIILVISLILLLTKNESILHANAKRAFYGTYKIQLIGNIIKLISDRFVYKPQNRVLNRIIIESELFGKISDFKGRNYIHGLFDESEIQMSELRLFNGISCVFEGFFVFVSKIQQDNVDVEAIKKLNETWIIKNDNLFIAFKGMKRLFEIQIEKSNRSIERTKSQTNFLVKVIAIACKAINAQLDSQYEIPAFSRISQEIIEDFKTFTSGNETYVLSPIVKRMQNVLIDQLSCFLLWLIVFGLVTIIVGGLNPYMLLVSYFLTFLFYYIFFETVYSKTIGKFITRTKVLTTDGDKPLLNTIIKRTFCRLIPFDSYSFINNEIGIHDNYSKTVVIIDENK